MKSKDLFNVRFTEAENEMLLRPMTHAQMMAFLDKKGMTIDELERFRVNRRSIRHRMTLEPLTDVPLHIITPVTRPHNLDMIIDSIIRADRPHNLSIQWHTIFKNNENRYNLINIYNKLLDGFSDGWFTMMCDDNHFHPKIFVELSKAIEANPDMGVFIVSCFGRHGGISHAAAENVAPMGVDASQTFVKMEALGDIRYDSKLHVDMSDSKIVMALYKKCPERFVFSDKVLAYYERIIRDDAGELNYQEATA